MTYAMRESISRDRYAAGRAVLSCHGARVRRPIFCNPFRAQFDFALPDMDSQSAFVAARTGAPVHHRFAASAEELMILFLCPDSCGRESTGNINIRPAR